MTVDSICPHCKVALTLAHAPAPGGMRAISFCPRCRFRQVGELMPGTIESDPDWFLCVQLSPPLQTRQLQALRAADAHLGALSAAQALVMVEQAPTLALGPYGRKTDMETAKRSLEAAGLRVDIAS